jgi:hypothetical protein
MTEQEQIKALAELDGKDSCPWCCGNGFVDEEQYDQVFQRDCGFCDKTGIGKDYLTSYDAIIPLIQKLNVTGSVIDNSPEDFHGYIIDMSPAQLCESLLKATGKWKE